MNWQKLLLAAGGVTATAAVLYFLLRDEAEAPGGSSAGGGGDDRKPKRTSEVTKEQVQQILNEIVTSQDSMRKQMKLLTKEMRARPLSFEETYERVRSVQLDDPLERHGLSMDEFDAFLSTYQGDPQIKAGIQRIMGGPGGEESGEVTQYTVTINKTSKLGLTSVTGPNGGRRIMDITAGGLVDTHNRANPNDKICVFDEIVDVNGVSGADPMSEELMQNKVMVMKILRRTDEGAAKDVDVQTLVQVHHAMLEELEKIVERFTQDPSNKAKYDMKTVTLAAQTVVGAKVEERYGLTSEDIERAVITHHPELSTNREFASVNVRMQTCMQKLLEP